MSKESYEWLNTNTLIGFTDKRGHFWHYREGLQGDEPNHYPLAIPVEDVERRLFAWNAVELPVSVTLPDGRVVPMEGTKAIARDDNWTIFSRTFAEGYKPHQYREWLLGNVATILDDELSISSAGLLRKGAVAWVEVSMPDNIETPEGVVFRPNLLAVTSFDGSLSTTYKRTITNVGCDNTMGMALAEDGAQVKVRHSKNSLARITDVRDALQIVYTTADDFQAEVAQLCAAPVTDKRFGKFRDVWAGLTELNGTPKKLEGRSLTLATTKAEGLDRLWTRDPRVKPWAGSKYGVVQAVNTFEHHEGIVKGMSRGERNALRTVTGKFDLLDSNTVKLLDRIPA